MNYRNQIEDIRARYLMGKITLEQAKVEAEPLIEKMNIRGKEIAKQYGKKFKGLTFGYIFR